MGRETSQKTFGEKIITRIDTAVDLRRRESTYEWSTANEIHAADLRRRKRLDGARADGVLRRVGAARTSIAECRAVSGCIASATGRDGNQRAGAQRQALRDRRSVCRNARAT